MSSTLCTCIRVGLTIVVPDDDCPATYHYLTHTTRKAETT